MIGINCRERIDNLSFWSTLVSIAYNSVRVLAVKNVETSKPSESPTDKTLYNFKIWTKKVSYRSKVNKCVLQEKLIFIIDQK